LLLIDIAPVSVIFAFVSYCVILAERYFVELSLHEIVAVASRIRSTTVSVIIRPWGRKIRAYWCYFPSTRGDVLMITLNLK